MKNTLRNLTPKRIIFIMVGVMLSVLLSSLDSTIVGTAMPKVINELQGMQYYTWPFTAYMLLSTISIPIFAKLADIFGRKPIYFIGISTFLLASALCGLAQNMTELILFRGLQGLGGGILMSNSFAIVASIFTPKERGKYMGFVTAMFGLASVIGPAVGGYITDNLNWRWIFYINLPVGLLAMVTMFFALPHLVDRSTKRVIDYLGAITLVLGLVPMLLAFNWADDKYAWLSPQILGMLGFAGVMFVVFGLIERKAVEPILPLNFFNNEIFNVSVVVSFLTNAVMFGSITFIPLFVQGVIGSSATNSGMVATPMMLGLVCASITSGQIISRTGKYKALAVIGYLTIVAGAVLLTMMDVHATNGLVVRNMIILGFGLGLTTPILNVAVQNAFPVKDLNLVTSANQFFRNIGGTIASAVLGSVMNAKMNSGFSHISLGHIPPALMGLLKNPRALTNPDTITAVKAHLPQQALPMFEQLMMQVRSILSNSIHEAFVVSLGIAIAALVIVFFLKEIPLGSGKHASEVEKVAPAAEMA